MPATRLPPHVSFEYSVDRSPARPVPPGTPVRRALHRVLGALVTDSVFRDRFSRDPDAAVSTLGLALTPYEVSIAISIQEDLAGLASEP